MLQWITERFLDRKHRKPTMKNIGMRDFQKSHGERMSTMGGSITTLLKCFISLPEISLTTMTWPCGWPSRCLKLYVQRVYYVCIYIYCIYLNIHTYCMYIYIYTVYMFICRYLHTYCKYCIHTYMCVRVQIKVALCHLILAPQAIEAVLTTIPLGGPSD